jgi:hypothetical protein
MYGEALSQACTRLCTCLLLNACGRRACVCATALRVWQDHVVGVQRRSIIGVRSLSKVHAQNDSQVKTLERLQWWRSDGERQIAVPSFKTRCEDVLNCILSTDLSRPLPNRTLQHQLTKSSVTKSHARHKSHNVTTAVPSRAAWRVAELDAADIVHPSYAIRHVDSRAYSHDCCGRGQGNCMHMYSHVSARTSARNSARLCEMARRIIPRPLSKVKKDS